MALTILVAALAVCGVFLILWTIGEFVTLPVPKDICHVVPLQGSAAAVEQTMRACIHSLRGRIFFVDCGIDAEAQMSAQLLLRTNNAAILCAREQLSEYLRWENELGAGTD